MLIALVVPYLLLTIAISWMLMEFTAAGATVPPVLVGLGFGVIGMAGGSLASRAPEHTHAPR